MGRRRGEPARRGAGARGDRRERLLDLVGDRGGQLAQEHHAIDALKILLGFPQRLLGLPARGDVVAGSRIAAGRPCSSRFRDQRQVWMTGVPSRFLRTSSPSQRSVRKSSARGVLSVDGEKVGQARIDRTVPFLFSADDLMDIGRDTGSPVTEDYETPQGRFTGNIAWVRIDIGKDAFEDAVGMDEALTGRS
jgi:hypothetical protein